MHGMLSMNSESSRLSFYLGFSSFFFSFVISLILSHEHSPLTLSFPQQQLFFCFPLSFTCMHDETKMCAGRATPLLLLPAVINEIVSIFLRRGLPRRSGKGGKNRGPSCFLMMAFVTLRCRAVQVASGWPVSECHVRRVWARLHAVNKPRSPSPTLASTWTTWTSVPIFTITIQFRSGRGFPPAWSCWLLFSWSL